VRSNTGTAGLAVGSLPHSETTCADAWKREVRLAPTMTAHENPAATRPGAVRLRPLLHVAEDALELVWLDGGHVRRSSVAVETSRTDLLAAAARELCASGPGSRAPLWLSLDEHTFETQQILLGRLPEREVTGVLERRAANAVGGSLDETLWFAQRLSPPFEQEGEANDSNWLLHVRRRREHHALLLALRDAGLSIERVVALRDVLPLAAAKRGTGGEVLVVWDGATVSTHLLRNGALVQHSRLRIPADASPKDANVAIVQEVRQVSAFWSKSSRGAPLETVSIVGLPEEQVEEMATPLTIAALGAVIERVGTSPDRSPDSVRRAFLFTVARLVPQAKNLTLALPPRRSRVAAGAAAATVAAAALGALHSRHWDSRVESRRNEIAAFANVASDVDVRAAERNAYENARLDLARAWNSLASLEKHGLPFEDVVQRVMRSLDGHARLTHITLTSGEDGAQILAEAIVEGPLDQAAADLDALRRGFQEAVWLKGVVVEPASRVPDGEDVVGLSFTLSARTSGGVR